jgi:hypothetical protein
MFMGRHCFLLFLADADGRTCSRLDRTRARVRGVGVERGKGALRLWNAVMGGHGSGYCGRAWQNDGDRRGTPGIMPRRDHETHGSKAVHLAFLEHVFRLVQRSGGLLIDLVHA